MTLELDWVLRTCGGRLEGQPRGDIGTFRIDTREIEPGDAFVALPGEHTDGHRFLRAAARAGAHLALVRHVPPDAPADLPLAVVESPEGALQTLASTHRDSLSAPLVAITGSNGKTSTKQAVVAALAPLHPCASPGNLNNHLGLPLSLLRMNQEHGAGVFELGMSHLGEIAFLMRILRPGLGVLTGIAEAHLEGVGTLEDVARAKGELVEGLPQDGLLAYNADCTWSRRLAESRQGPRLGVSISGRPEAAVSLAQARVGLTSLSAEVRVRGAGDKQDRGDWALRFSKEGLVGLHMAYPILFACAVASHLGLAPCQVEAALAEHYVPAPGRMEVVRLAEAMIVNDCYNANPASTGAALDYLDSVTTPGKKLAVLGEMLELGPSAVALHRRILERCLQSPSIDRIWLVGPSYEAAYADLGLPAPGSRSPQPGARSQEPAARSPQSGARSQEPGAGSREPGAGSREPGARSPRPPFLVPPCSKEDVARDLKEMLGPGDVLLLKGSRGIALETILDDVRSGAPNAV